MIEIDIIESATGIGFISKHILYKIQIPLEFLIIMTGIRISAALAF